MQRVPSTPRPDWQARVERVGLTYHSHEQGPYWDESVCYRFSMAEILALEKATKELHDLCIEAAEHVISQRRWSDLAVPETAVPAILESWERDDFSLYGRFDLALGRDGALKLLEYNADTPTSLVEAAVAQWYWLQDLHPQADQFNSLHERLIAAWRRLSPRHVHFASVAPHDEDEQTILYLRDTLLQAGIPSTPLSIEQIGWDARISRFVDLENQPLDFCFKLYPWEWLWSEPFARHLPSATRWLEPPWKMLLSNKGLLPVLWELFPEHPLLLPAYFEPEPLAASFVRKPFLSREGANVLIVEDGTVLAASDGHYDGGPFVYQARADLGDHAGKTPVLGSWIVDHEAAGLGIREDRGLITGNLSRFVPHLIA